MAEFYFLRKLDYYLGKLCNSILPFSFSNKDIKRPYKIILLIKLWGLGNLTVIWPLIYKIKEKTPDSFIYFLTFDLNRGFLEKNQAINKIIYFKFTKNIFRIMAQIVTVLINLRKQRIDLAINFETLNNASGLFSYLIKASVRIGINNKYEKIFYNCWVENNPSLHISQIFLKLLKPLGVDYHYNYYYFSGSKKVKNRVEAILEGLGIDKFICIHPGTSKNFEGKRWNPENFSELSTMLMRRYSLPLVFTGSRREESLIKGIIEEMPFEDKIYNLAGRLNIQEFIELLKKSFLFISNDTGPVHIAASLGVNTVVFYGPTSPVRYKPLNENSLIFYRHLKCSPCIGMNYEYNGCKNKFSCLDFFPQEVFSKISEKYFDEQRI